MPRISRRKFITRATAAGAGTCMCGLSGCATFSKVGKTPSIPADAYSFKNGKLTILLGKVAQLEKIGGSIKIIDSKLPEPLIIARIEEKEYTAVSIKCPHRGVEVEYKHDSKQFRCASLGSSTFATDGTHKKGFAKKSLTRFDAKLDPSDPNSLIISMT